MPLKSLSFLALRCSVRNHTRTETQPIRNRTGCDALWWSERLLAPSPLTYSTRNGTLHIMQNGLRLRMAFFRTETGREPVREWLQSLADGDRKTIGSDILAVQYGWPLGMPLVRKLEKDLWEVRSTLDDRLARVLFTLEGATMVALHGFIKKSQRTPKADLDVAKTRLRTLRGRKR